jgi:hypothetical protein
MLFDEAKVSDDEAFVKRYSKSDIEKELFSLLLKFSSIIGGVNIPFRRTFSAHMKFSTAWILEPSFCYS